MRRREFLFTAAAASAATRIGDIELPDFSNCGYAGGGVALPDAPVRLAVKPEPGDATERIQAAIDKVAAMPAKDRGAVLLPRGEYAVGGTLRIHASGIVLRGEAGSVLVGTGTKPRSLIEVRGGGTGKPASEAVEVLDEVVPVGARSFRVASAKPFRLGQLVVVRRSGNAAWIHEIGMDRIKPRPGQESTTKQWQPFNLDFERTVTAVDGNRITVDAPVMCAIEKRWGGGAVFAWDDSARVRSVGIEKLRAVSEFDRTVTATHGREKETYFADEAHARSLITIDNAVDCWVRAASAFRFIYACVELRRTRAVTVQDCDCREMVSQITGGRRYPYAVGGQLTLVQRCAGETGRHDFVVHARVPGPNVFLRCKSGRSFATSEPHHRWSVGGLYDNVHADIAVQDRQYYGSGHGWSGANYVLWNCRGSLVCQKPPTANNWAIGHVGERLAGAFAPRPDGTWRSYGKHVEPESLYEAQLAARLKGNK